MNKYLYKIKDLEIPTHLKYWFARKSKINLDLSEILNGSSFDLTDTVNKKLHLINIFGNSVQETTIGKNRLNSYVWTATSNGVNITYDNESQIITLNGECTEDNTTFQFLRTSPIQLIAGETLYGLIKYEAGVSNGYFALRCFNNDYSQGMFVVTRTPISSNITNSKIFNSNINLSLFDLRCDKGSTFNDLKIKVMFSTVDAVYEPYTNGASPNPDYPQEIKSSGDNDYITEKIVNKNGHQEQTYTIPCQQPMRAIGDVKDTFVKVNGVWYERHIIEKGVLGTENYGVATCWEAPDKSTADNYNTAFFGILIPHTVLNSVFLCNRFEYTGENYWSTDKEGLQLTTADNRFRMRIAKNKLDGYNNDLTNVQKCRLLSDYLNNNPTEVFYNRIGPLDLPCTPQQITALEAIQKARTYKNVTHIYSEDEVPADLEIQYYKEKGE